MSDQFEDGAIKPILIPEDYDSLIPKKKKPFIVAMIEEEIRKQGATGKLVFNGIESGYKTNRKMYYPKSGVFVFEEYMSQLNTLPLNFLEVEVREIVSRAKRHFKIV
ncbi:MAG: hypothetical protein H7X94_01390 [Vallitaleaceae bacterium]|nr:hypothetical protein [Vallitaleaceae bacterium]